MTDCCINITIGRGRPKVLQATSLMLRGGCCYYSAYILQYRQKSHKIAKVAEGPKLSLTKRVMRPCLKASVKTTC